MCYITMTPARNKFMSSTSSPSLVQKYLDNIEEDRFLPAAMLYTFNILIHDNTMPHVSASKASPFIALFTTIILTNK